MLAGILLLQQAVTASIPHRDGLTIVQAIAGDTLRGSARGDYEATIVVTDFASHGVEFFSRAFVRNDAGQRAWLSVRRTVRVEDLRAARTLILGFDTHDATILPGTTALGPSLAVMADARRAGEAAVRVRNFAARADNPGTLHRVGAGTEPFPILLNGQRILLPAHRLRGQLGPPGHLRPWSFWFLDDPVQPLTLKVTYGAEGAPESAPPEWQRQIVRIDVPEQVELAAETATGDEENGDGGALPDGSGRVGAGTGGAPPAASGGGGGGGGTGRGRAGLQGAGAAASISRQLEGSCRVEVPGIYFEFDSDRLNPASDPWINTVARVLQQHPDWQVTIEGHTDSIGGARYNQDLSQRRAAALRQELVTRYRVDTGRLSTRGYGASRAREPNTTVEGRARNRRVELVRPCDS
jgi:outer membrane protein OmpA-like peptidoglycan-associated protein